jgi:Xaa-Pro aminopeptidase
MLTHQESLHSRRQRLYENLPNGSIFIVFSAQIQMRNSDVENPWRQDSDFYYLTGIDEDQAVFIMSKDHNGDCKTKLFVQTKTHEQQIWTGAVNGLEKSKMISEIFDVDLFENYLSYIKNLGFGPSKLYFDMSGSYQTLRDQTIAKIYNNHRRARSENCESIHKPSSILKHMRMYKDEYEIVQLLEASRINILAHQFAFTTIKAKIDAGQRVYEYEFQAELEKVWRQYNCTMSYYPIVASGDNATTLHYNKNNAIIDPTKYLLVDAGCEYNYYASDITRCYHFGTPTLEQTNIYNLVEKCNRGVIEFVASGKATYRSYHELCCEILTQGLIDLGLLNGTLQECLKDKSYKKYFMHGVGHWLGLDVHDSGVYLDQNSLRADIPLTAGMCLTVEPGLYFDPTDENIPEGYRGIGVRIEDDVVVKDDVGVLVLSEGLKMI